MPGIVGYCSADCGPNSFDSQFDCMLMTLLHEPFYAAKEARTAVGHFGCVHLDKFNHGVITTTPDQKVGVVLDGWIFLDDNDAGDAVDHCLSAYLETGIRFIRKLNGQFNLLIWDERSQEVFLCNDRYGLRPWQYALVGEQLYFAPEGKAILGGSKIGRRLNKRMVVNQLSWGRVWIGNETLFENIFILPPASVLHWQDGKVSQAQYWDYEFNPVANVDDDFVAYSADTFRRAVARQTQAPLRYGLGLSGGLDSRVVLAALAGALNGNLTTYSWGVNEKNDEVSLARETAARADVPWKFLAQEPEDYVNNGPRGAYISEGQDLAVQSYGLNIFPAIRRGSDVLLTGLALDLTLGGSYLSQKLLDAELTNAAALSWIREQSELFSAEESMRLLRFPGAETLLRQLSQEAIDNWQSGQGLHPADQSDRFFLHTRVRRYTFARQLWQRLFVEDLAPTFDNDFIDCLLSIPPDWRAGHRFYQKFLQHLCPAFMSIPYQRTMLPPFAPVDTWPLGAKLEAQKELLYRKIWHDTDGQVFIPYLRYSTNYDEWLRRDGRWMGWVDNLLLGPESLSGEFLDRGEVARMVQQHRSGQSAKHKQIIQLLTFEFFLQQFFH